MKQTNNAIKFLLAQYRAIFKNAYFKGLVGAVVLTAGMGVATQASAANTAGLETAGNPITDTDTSFVIDTTGAVWNADVTLTTKNSSQNTVKESAGALEVTGSGNLTVNGVDAGISFKARATNAANITLTGKADILQGKVEVGESEATGNTKVTFGNITIGQSSTGTAVVNVNKSGSLIATEKLSIAKTGTLNINNSSTKVSAGTIEIVGGNIATGGSTTKATLESTNGIDFSSGIIDVKAGDTLTISSKASNAADLDETKDTFSIGADAEIKVGGGLTISQGLVEVAEGAKILSSVGSGSPGVTDFIKIGTDGTGKTEAIATLKINSKTLSNYLAGTDDFDSGSLTLDDQSKLLFSDTEAVDLGKFTFASDDTAQGSGKINVVDTPVAVFVEGDKFTLSKASYETGSATFVANTLVLDGKEGADQKDGSVAGLGASSKIKNLEFANGAKLTGALGLNSTKEILDEQGTPKTVADTGSITGTAKIGDGTTAGTLTIQDGTYTANNGIKLNKGTLAVGNGSSAKVPTSLTVLGQFGWDNTKDDNTINVSGSGSGKLATLDLTKAELDVKNNSTTKATTITVDKGIFKANAEQVKAILANDPTVSSSSGAKIVLADSGSLVVVDDLNLVTTDFGSGHGQINLSTTSSTLEGLGKVTVSGDTTSGLNIGSGTIKANVLELKDNRDLPADQSIFKITGGSYQAVNGLNSTNEVIDLASSTLTLGGVKKVDNENYYESLYTSSGSTIGSKLKVSGNTPAVEVHSGVWNASEITLEAGALKVGYLDTTSGNPPVKNENGDIIGATLNADKVTMTDGTFTINEGSKSKLTELALTAGTITVEGELTIDGKYTPETTSGDDTIPASYGIAYTDSSIKVDGGKLTLGAAAIQGIEIGEASGSGDTAKQEVKFADDASLAKLNLTNRGEVVLSFTSGTSFNKDGLKNLKGILFDATSSSNGKLNGLLNINDAQILGYTDQISGGKVEWGNIKEFGDIGGTVTQNAMKNAIVTKIATNDEVVGHFGALQAGDGFSTYTKIKVTGTTSLNDAKVVTSGGEKLFAFNENGTVLGLNVLGSSSLALNNGGKVGDITLGNDSELIINGAGNATTLGEISGETRTLLSINGEGTVETSNVNVKDLVSVAGSVLNVTGDLTSTGSVELEGKTAVSGAAVVGSLSIDGETSFGKTLKVNAGADIYANTTVGTDAEFAANVYIGSNATLKANSIKFAQDSTVTVGEESGSDINGSWEDAAGFIEVGRLDLNGATLIADPEYGKSASIVVAGSLGGKTAIATDKNNLAGELNGTVVAARNSVIALGVEADENNSAIDLLKGELSGRFMDANGSLDKETVGSIVYVGEAVNVAGGSNIILDSTKSKSQYENATNSTHVEYGDGTYAKSIGNSIYLGANTALVIHEDALGVQVSGKERAAIDFTDSNASIYGAGGKIILAGSSIGANKYFLIDDTDNKLELNFAANATETEKKIAVESINTLFTGTLDTTGYAQLGFNSKNAEKAYIDTSVPVRDTLLAYVTNDADWKNINTTTKDADGNVVKHEQVVLHNGVATDVKYNEANKLVYVGGENDGKEVTVADKEKYITIYNADKKPVAYNKAQNSFLSAITNSDRLAGRDADTVARFGAFGGGAQAALAASSAMTDAIASRVGFAGNANLSAANNGQGTSLWVAPLYKSADSDGFGAQGVKYGVDVNMYGLALGGDYTLTNGVKFGAMFNVGSGDADGNGQASNVSNDFDYYGFGLYAGYTFDKLALLADLSYTVVDNDVTGNTVTDKLASSMDSKALSLGVTAQYDLTVGTMNVTPHAGLRYTSVDLDDFIVKGETHKDVAHIDSADLNVFSIPVGVTFSKEIISGEWLFKPMFDLTLTANVGDDKLDNTVEWNGIQNLNTKVSNEVLDGFTYGATAGFEMKNNNFSLGLGVNYTGSSNTDGYGINANARFVF